MERRHRSLDEGFDDLAAASCAAAAAIDGDLDRFCHQVIAAVGADQGVDDVALFVLRLDPPA